MLYNFCKFFHLLFLIFLITNVYAQQKRLKRENFLTDFVFSGNHIKLNFSILSTAKAQLRNEIGDYPVKTKPALGLILGLNYQVNFNNEYSLITGIEGRITGRNFITSFNKNDFSPPLVKDYKISRRNSYTPDLIVSVPILIEKRLLYAKTKFFFADAGICINSSTGPDFDSFFILLLKTSNEFYNAGGVDVYANNDARPWVSFPLTLGHAWLFKNNNLFQVSLCTNLSFTKYVNGIYHINIPGRTLTQGKYSSTGSFIGLSMNYVFTNANYRIRKEYQRKGF